MSKQESTPKTINKKQLLLGSLLEGAGSGLINHNITHGNLTGRENLYVRVPKSQYKSTILNGVNPEIPMYRNKYTNILKDSYDMGGMGRSLKQKTVKVKLPVWMTPNLPSQHMKDWNEYMDTDGIVNKMQAMNQNNMFGDKGTVTKAEQVASKYLPKSKAYQKISLDEIKKFVKANPQRFKKGLLSTLAGATMAGVGVHLMTKNMDFNKILHRDADKKASWETSMEKKKAEAYFNIGMKKESAVFDNAFKYVKNTAQDFIRNPVVKHVGGGALMGAPLMGAYQATFGQDGQDLPHRFLSGMARGAVGGAAAGGLYHLGRIHYNIPRFKDMLGNRVPRA